MKLFRTILLFLCFISFISSTAFSQDLLTQTKSKQLIATLENLANEALDGYNLGDYIKFYEFFTKTLKEIITQQYFQAVFIDGYKKEFGDIYSKELLLDKSNLDLDYPTLVYKAVFEKNNDILVTINFVNEYGAYRISHIKYDKYSMMIDLP